MSLQRFNGASRRKWLIGLGLLALLLFSLWWVWPFFEDSVSVVETSTAFTLYSLQPELDGRTPVSNEKFAGYPVYGKVKITDPAVRDELMKALKRGIAENTSYEAACFEPRHGIRAVKGRRSVKMVICFSCAQIHVEGRKILVSASPQREFDEVLKKAKVPLGPR